VPPAESLGKKYGEVETRSKRKKMQRLSAVLLLQLLLFGKFLSFSTVEAHGFLAQPVSRNKNAVGEYCPHCYNGGGTGTVSSFGVSWPYPETPETTKRHGICGDAATVTPLYSGPQFTSDNIVETYTAGSDIDLSVVITAHHMGWFEFRVCDKSELNDPKGEITQACLDRHQLLRAPSDPSESPIDPEHPERFYTPPKCAFGGAEMRMSMRYTLPADLECEHCVLQWYWVTANTCAGDDYESVIPLFPSNSCGGGDGGAVGWIPGPVLPSNIRPRLCSDENSGYPEEFWNCADIRIVSSEDGNPVQETDAPATSSPTAQMTTAPPTSSATYPTNTPVEQHGKLTLKGVQLVGEHQEPVQLLGMSSHGLHWFPDCYSKASIKYLVDNWGITLFRAAMYIGENGYASTSQRAALEKQVQDIVQWTKELGIYVMIDWHVLTPGDPNAYLDLSQDFWASMAERYKSEKHVLYEIANEPNNVQWSRVLEYHNAVIGTIREIDSETIIIAGTTTWSQDIHLAAAAPVDAPYNVMYAFHFYAGTHASLLQRVRETAPKIPIFSTEWGTSQASGDGGPYLNVAKDFLDAYAELGISWAAWSYADKNEVSAALKPGACGRQAWGDASASGAFIRDYILQSNGAITTPPPEDPSTMAPTTETTATPTDPVDEGACSAAWGQCGGKNWNGPTCCTTGYYCNSQNQWYSQCIKGNAPGDANDESATNTPVDTEAPTDAPPPTATGSPTTPDAGSSCSAAWGQCGGKNWNGPTCCTTGYYCNSQNQWYSQCIKGNAPGDANDESATNTPVDTEAPTDAAPPADDGGSSCSAIWKQCGGQNWNGPSCCAEGLRCNRQSKWYSQCVKAGSLRGLR
jgi:aryl-phospho-beta-D-glucosidase BglC (GH1 family)